MSKKKKQESKKQRKNRIRGHEANAKGGHKYNNQTTPYSMPRSWEEAVRMGML